ncbi:DNA-3-methyladenine glycosylase [Kangiella sp. TOML190]|uniref:DNA-3-methyladenine glycosylase family protein n=1 Tax=Kangiella sp. TOML190 TaxID=2931351 RepID=UPI00203D8709|nr:DNA-3-methyladenine glycosylase [Kangiella sp. TOML190]
MPFSRSPFEYLVRSIISQQLSSKAASTIVGRVERALGRKKINARNILALSHRQLRECGLSNAKVSYCHAIAQAEIDNKISFKELYGQGTDEVITALTGLKGVGVWTAQMFCVFALGHLDVLATADVGLQRGMQKLYQLPTKPSAEQMLKISKPWQPYRSIASWYLWKIADSS